ncbi:hypothetical protein PC116_g15024 [Phytophthora cactorum]|uniref:Uncharacterized protein n=1 Tax=Phytophthora cactorum TaxID=29920 RepID=A0A8T1KIL4_9STRA|nr:hypothetical protein PC117_g16966 [Phytophthora cactorum]KAG3009171.1 hypothetical protein PC120_g15783 [Phytophthora cactorum]KAG3015572.1 hypothetical protein PC119_g11718 [Phytophthora cactorum]KAG4048763.1 hypothetical protein PC123_g15941 [Phytophthora cactorum]KAG4236894.1 hypothetical protein PC116_g15024 [Phytophthora cactorum]
MVAPSSCQKSDGVGSAVPLTIDSVDEPSGVLGDEGTVQDLSEGEAVP